MKSQSQLPIPQYLNKPIIWLS